MSFKVSLYILLPWILIRPCFALNEDQIITILSGNNSSNINLIKEIKDSFNRINNESKNLEKSCLYFKELSTKMRDQLPMDLLILKQIKFCGTTEEEILTFWPKISPYAIDTFLEISANSLEKLKPSSTYLKILLQISKNKKIRLDKIELLKKGINIAQKANLKDELNLLKNELELVAPIFIKFPKRDKYFSVGMDYEQDRKYTNARSYYQKILKDKKFTIEEKIKAWNRLRLSYKKERKNKEYMKETQKMGAFLIKNINDKNPAILEAYLENQINLARAIWTGHDIKKAETILTNCLKFEKAKDNTKGLINWILGQIEIEKEDRNKAMNYFNEGIKFNITDEDTLDKLQWAITWNTYQQGEYDKTIENINAFLNKTENNNQKYKYVFWLAKSLDKIGKKSEAIKFFKELDNENPFGYYGGISRIILELAPRKIDYEPYHSLPLRKDFFWLLYLEENNLAKEYLNILSDELKNENDILDHLPLFQMSKLYQEGISLFFKIPQENREHYIEKNITLLYPKDFSTEISSFSSKEGVPDSLIYSIIRQESSFNPYARSWADAFGLMQLTPETAKIIAKQNKKLAPTHNELYDPLINIPLGITLLKNLIAKFNGHLVPSIASYNAGSSVVGKWMKDRFEEDEIEFIEKMPYEETRTYVKLVLRNTFIYQAMGQGPYVHYKNNRFIFNDYKSTLPE